MPAKPLLLSILEKGGFRGCRLCLVLTMVALTACSSSSRIEQQSKIARSAAQTAAMVVDAWIAGAVPSNYASATLQSAADTLADAERQIESGYSSETPERRGVITAIGRLSAAARRAQARIKAGSPPQVSQAVQELRTAATEFAAAYDRYSAPKS
ncbi:hypothetical protein [Mesorhizobium silamurunense]|uniref:hypothetical protein n=1 Tax=Mesorhizobium silamurunense TaxID=499528 RepID=UPI00177B84BA|nr:hypothetical protein [Mesorhizobium silamurunense]